MTKELGNVIIGDGGPGILPDEDEAAIVAGGPMAGNLGGEPEKTLLDAKFVIGDYVTCTILPALANGAVPPIPARGAFGNSSRGGGFGGDRMIPGGPRENGFGFRGRGGPRARGGFGEGMGPVPSGEWRRGERVPEGPAVGGGRGRGGYGGGFGGRGSRY
jgi:histone deacetylase complex subunit SAP18